MKLSEYLASFDGPLAHLVLGFCPEVPPDPWPEDVDAAVRSLDAVPLCIDCLCPQEGHRWFCPHCGKATGEFVAWMPYLQLFLVGEIFRKGVLGPPDKRKGPLIFLVLYSLSEYAVFAPLYWFWLFRRARGRPICCEVRKPLQIEDDA